MFFIFAILLVIASSSLKADSVDTTSISSGKFSGDPYHIIELIIAGSGILIGVFVARKQNQASTITHFREKWLNELRTSYCDAIAIHEAICQRLKLIPLEPTEHFKRDPKADPDWHKLNFQTTKIKLLLHHDPDSNDQKHPAFWGMFMDYIEQSFDRYSEGHFPEEDESVLEKLRYDVEIILLSILKDEWEKLKLLEKKKWF